MSQPDDGNSHILSLSWELPPVNTRLREPSCHYPWNIPVCHLQAEGASTSSLYPWNYRVPPQGCGNPLVFILGIIACHHHVREQPCLVFISGITMCHCQAEGIILSLSQELLCVTTRLWKHPRLIFIPGITVCHRQAEGTSMPCLYPRNYHMSLREPPCLCLISHAELGSGAEHLLINCPVFSILSLLILLLLLFLVPLLFVSIKFPSQPVVSAFVPLSSERVGIKGSSFCRV